MKFAVLFFLLCAAQTFACTDWVADNSGTCIFGDMGSGIRWKRQCPDTVCRGRKTIVNGQRIQKYPCDKEEICMPKTHMDGPRIPGQGVVDVETNPNNFGETLCQLWYPINSDNPKQAGCDVGNKEIVWSRECTIEGGSQFNTRTCSAGYPN